MKQMRFGSFSWAICAVLLAFAAPASAYEVRVLGLFGNQAQTEKIEKPFWEQAQKDSGGKLSVTYRTLNEVSLKGFDSLRVLQAGTFDIVSVQVGFVSGDDPVLLGHDLPGLAFDFKELRSVVNAYTPVIQERLRTRHQAKLLAQYPFPPQIMYCKGEIKSLSDLKGRRIRVASAVVSDMIRSWGGVPVTLAGTEVYQALQRGVIDCGITGSAFGNSYNWFEIADNLYELPFGGYALVVIAASNRFWDRLKPEEQAELQKMMKVLEDKLWAIGQDSHDDGVRCNTGVSPCVSGKPAKMKLVKPSASDVIEFRKTLAGSVLDNWFKDCERVLKGCRGSWESSVGAVTNLR